MAHHVDGFVIPIKKENVPAYRRMVRSVAAIWREHGALEFRELVGDDLKPGMGLPFPRGIKARSGETIISAWIVYKSRAHRDRVGRRVMADGRIAGLCDEKTMPFDAQRMLYGGFKVIASA